MPTKLQWCVLREVPGKKLKARPVGEYLSANPRTIPY